MSSWAFCGMQDRNAEFDVEPRDTLMYWNLPVLLRKTREKGYFQISSFIQYCTHGSIWCSEFKWLLSILIVQNIHFKGASKPLRTVQNVPPKIWLFWTYFVYLTKECLILWRNYRQNTLWKCKLLNSSVIESCFLKPTWWKRVTSLWNLLRFLIL